MLLLLLRHPRGVPLPGEGGKGCGGLPGVRSAAATGLNFRRSRARVRGSGWGAGRSLPLALAGAAEMALPRDG